MVQGCKLDSTGSGQGPEVGSSEHGNEPSCTIKGWEFLPSIVIISLSRTLFHEDRALTQALVNMAMNLQVL
jgi:hypothetical protein